VWAFLRNELPDQVLIPAHLQVIQQDASTYQLCISTRLLLDDLEAAIRAFRVMGPSRERITLWNRAARNLTQPKPHDFRLDAGPT